MRIRKERCKEYFQYMLDAIEKPAMIAGFDGQIQYINNSFQQCFSINAHQQIQKALTVESLEDWQSALSRIKAEGNISCNLNFYPPHYRDISTMADLIYVEEFNHILVVFTPEQSSMIMTMNMVNWEIFFKHTDHIKLLIDGEGKIIQKNVLAQEFFGVQGEELIGQECLKLLKLKFKDSFTLDLKAIATLEETGQCTAQIVCHENGELLYFKVKVKRIVSKETYFFLTMINETEQIIEKQRLTQKDSLLEIGQLAASIAHEIRNPITTLKGFTQLLKITAAEDSLKYLEVIDDEIERMESILTEMLKLSKPAIVEKKLIALDELLLDLERIMYPKATIDGIKIITTLNTDDKVFILGEEQKLKQVLLNLMKNSFEAMTKSGTLKLELKKHNEDFINITITDTGKGIEKEHLKRVFMPYFTTRQDGTGLGLPFVLKTVQEHNGKITVSSEKDKGTRFIMTFPIAKDQFISQKDDSQEVIYVK